MMANDAVRVELPERACVVALGHFRLDGSPLQPESRAAILRSAESAHGHVQTVTCTRAEAEDLLDYFAQAIQVLSRVGDRRVRACLTARKKLAEAIRDLDPSRRAGSA